MINKIGEKIKILRKKANITQEKFADYLGITFQSVSRWESGICYPDLEILPSIANYFNITTDELLGVDIMNKQKKVDEIHQQVNDNFKKGLIDENIAILRAAINEFPNDYNLLSDLAYYLGMKDDTMNGLKEPISIYERILADCTDDHIRYNVMYLLASSYKKIGEKEKAIEIAKKLPAMHHNRDMVLSYVYDGEEQINKLRKNIEYYFDFVTNDIINFACAKYNDDKDTDNIQKRIELYKKAITLYELMYEDGNYGFYNERMSNLYLDEALNYIILNDFDNALDCVEKAAAHTITYDTMPEVYIYTSMIFKGTEFTSAYKKHPYNLTYKMLYIRLSEEKLNPLRETERFKDVVAKLEQYAKKEK